jgi:hypothetical protein
MSKPLPSIAHLRRLLSYDPETGILTWWLRTPAMFAGATAAHRRSWCARWNKRYAGTVAGALQADGYRQVKIHDRPMLAHRVAWAIYHGEWPEIVSHIDGVGSNNRIVNLRSVSRQICQRNQKRHASNTSGRTGVSWSRVRSIWVAQIKIGEKSHYLGSFSEFDDAVAARIEAEKLHNFTGKQ